MLVLICCYDEPLREEWPERLMMIMLIAVVLEFMGRLTRLILLLPHPAGHAAP